MQRRKLIQLSGAALTTGGMVGLAGCSSLPVGPGGNSNGGFEATGEIVENPYDDLELIIEDASLQEYSEGRLYGLVVSGRGINNSGERLTSNRPSGYSFELEMRVFDGDGTQLGEPSQSLMSSFTSGEETESNWNLTYTQGDDYNYERIDRYEISVR